MASSSGNYGTGVTSGLLALPTRDTTDTTKITGKTVTYGSGVQSLLGSSYNDIVAANTSLDGTDITGLDKVSPTALADYGVAAEDKGIATAQGIMQAGDLKEATAYDNASAIANANARLATISGQIQQSQEGIKVTKELGSQASDVSGSGFSNTGSAVYLMRASKYQGALANQLYGTDAAIKSGGYLSQAAASQAQADAANTAADYAGQLATNATTAAGYAKDQGNLAQALSLNTAAGTTTTTTKAADTGGGLAAVYNSDGTKAKAGSTDNSAFAGDTTLYKADIANQATNPDPSSVTS